MFQPESATNFEFKANLQIKQVEYQKRSHMRYKRLEQRCRYVVCIFRTTFLEFKNRQQH